MDRPDQRISILPVEPARVRAIVEEIERAKAAIAAQTGLRWPAGARAVRP